MNALSERHVQAIWYDAALRPQRLVTRRGSAVRVVSPGAWNLGAGPDFTRAVLEIGPARTRVVGDVEVHLCPADWDFHGHGADPRYRNVVAHVTWGGGPEPSSLPPGAVSIWLGRFVKSDPSFSPDQIDLAAYPFARLPEPDRPCRERLAEDPDRATALLAEAGRHRLRMKARRIGGRLAERASRSSERTEAASQVFYEEVMTALGYSRNTVPFRRLAERVPVSALPEDPAAASTALVTAARFEDWDLSATRPGNDPSHRVAAAGALFADGDVRALSGARDFSRGGCRVLVGTLVRDRRVGRGRAAAILANVLAPFALAEGRLSEVPDWLPPEDISEPVRLTAFRLFGRDHNPAAFYAGNGLLIQGLLQIWRDFCLQVHPDCETCAFAQALAHQIPSRR